MTAPTSKMSLNDLSIMITTELGTYFSCTSSNRFLSSGVHFFIFLALRFENPILSRNSRSLTSSCNRKKASEIPSHCQTAVWINASRFEANNYFESSYSYLHSLCPCGMTKDQEEIATKLIPHINPLCVNCLL